MNALLQSLRLKLPIIQAPMAGVQNEALAIAVSRAGGLGSIPAAMLTMDALEAQLATLQSTGLAYNVNFFCHSNPAPDDDAQRRWKATLAPYYAEHGIDPTAIPAGAGRAPFSAEACALVEKYKPSVVSFHFGLPSPELAQRVKACGAQVWSSATTVAESIWLQANGADAVIAQGLEAGGHRGHFLSHDLSEQMGTFALLPLLDAALKVPVIAAGGISTPQGVKAALELGAAAAQIGTAYLLCHEATTSKVHRAALQSEAARHTQLTRVFTGRPARGIRNRLMAELGAMHEAAPAFPMATGALAPLRAAAEAKGSSDFSPLWCGQNTSGCEATDAGTLTARLAALV